MATSSPPTSMAVSDGATLGSSMPPSGPCVAEQIPFQVRLERSRLDLVTSISLSEQSMHSGCSYA